MKCKCIDCGTPLTWKDGILRCRKCQTEFNKRLQKLAYERLKGEKEEKEKNGAVIIDGHPQICKFTKSCKYGSVNGCSYILAEGKSRVKQGFIIRDGKCGAYKRGRKINCEIKCASHPKEQHSHNFIEV